MRNTIILTAVTIFLLAISVAVAFSGSELNEMWITDTPNSHDPTWQVPEFPIMALSIAVVIGLVFIFQHRRNKEE